MIIPIVIHKQVQISHCHIHGGQPIVSVERYVMRIPLIGPPLDRDLIIRPDIGVYYIVILLSHDAASCCRPPTVHIGILSVQEGMSTRFCRPFRQIGLLGRKGDIIHLVVNGKSYQHQKLVVTKQRCPIRCHRIFLARPRTYLGITKC